MASSVTRPMYPIGVPEKFTSEGVLQRFPGNTTVCHLPNVSPLLPGLKVIYDALGSHPILSKRIHLLPPASWHVTILTGVREKECKSGAWPLDGRESQTLSECTNELAPKIRQLGLEIQDEGLAPPYRLRVRQFDPAIIGIGLEVEGATADEEKRLRRLRDRLADTIGFRTPDHDSYGFHISLAYLLRHIDGQEREELDKLFARHLPEVRREFELGAVEFCTFENMYAFSRLFYLGERE